MVLYSADIMDIAEPVKSVKSRKRKVKEITEVESPPPVESPVKVKKTRKKAVPTPEPESPTPPPTPTPTPAPKKRRLKKVIEKTEPTEVEPVVEPVVEKVVEKIEKVVEKVVEKVEPKPKRVRVKKDPTIAPQWFNKYVESVQKEKQQLSETKVPAKQLKIESQEVAKKRWEDGLTRDRVHDEMNNHMGRMYKMIFSGR